MQKIDDLEKFLEDAGMVGGPGIQINIPVGWIIDTSDQEKMPLITDSERTEGTYCDHHCAEGGKYTCPAAFHTVDPNTFAPGKLLVEGIRRNADALRRSRDTFLNDGSFESYVKQFGIRGPHARALKNRLQKSRSKVDVNFFGGEPGWHRETGYMASELKSEPDLYAVILTTTGSPMMKSESVARTILSSPFDTLALSVDGLDSDRIYELCALSPEGIKREWNRVITTGSEKKAYEAIYAAKLAEGKIGTMFNIVVHPGNLQNGNHDIYGLIDALDENLPGVRKNPYFAQSSFSHEAPVFNKREAKQLEQFVDYMIDEQMNQLGQKDKKFVPRLHYWLLEKAIFDTFKGEELLKALSGYDVWKCYRAGIAGSYGQIGRSPKPNGKIIPGGHPGCFWNDETVTAHDKQVWEMSPWEIDGYIANMNSLAASADNPCPGCKMPRLAGNLTSVELGMNPALQPAYCNNRVKYASF